MKVSMSIENKIGQLKQIEQQLQGIMGQRYQMEMKVSDTAKALEGLDDVSKNTPVYKSSGKLLFKVADHKKLKETLSEEKEMLEIRMESLEKQENTLRTTYESLLGQIQAAMGEPGVSE